MSELERQITVSLKAVTRSVDQLGQEMVKAVENLGKALRPRRRPRYQRGGFIDRDPVHWEGDYIMSAVRNHESRSLIGASSNHYPGPLKNSDLLMKLKKIHMPDSGPLHDLDVAVQTVIEEGRNPPTIKSLLDPVINAKLAREFYEMDQNSKPYSIPEPGGQVFIDGKDMGKVTELTWDTDMPGGCRNMQVEIDPKMEEKLTMEEAAAFIDGGFADPR